MEIFSSYYHELLLVMSGVLSRKKSSKYHGQYSDTNDTEVKPTSALLHVLSLSRYPYEERSSRMMRGNSPSDHARGPGTMVSISESYNSFTILYLRSEKRDSIGIVREPDHYSTKARTTSGFSDNEQ